MGKLKENFWLQPEQVALVVVDVQEKLVPAMNSRVSGALVQHIELLLEGFASLALPVIATEQYSKGLGHTISSLNAATRQSCIEKTSFSCCGEPSFMAALEKTGAKQVVLVGMEAHVCVLQTLLDLRDQGYTVHLVKDAVCSRFKSDFETAVATATAAGAVMTSTEIVLFQLVGGATHPGFKTVSQLARRRTL
ncbi:isochorismatase family protein [Geopsychrobacter electrodiphilus]|uniref:isochorismatase family protein n=1 Tax=Geopsychrobacter electrodiphilus TaxID=225196 RepID=UPI000378C69F|nr:isochorismatase family protein [Geopsychrobacter electrodiphilus]